MPLINDLLPNYLSSVVSHNSSSKMVIMLVQCIIHTLKRHPQSSYMYLHRTSIQLCTHTYTVHWFIFLRTHPSSHTYIRHLSILCTEKLSKKDGNTCKQFSDTTNTTLVHMTHKLPKLNLKLMEMEDKHVITHKRSTLKTPINATHLTRTTHYNKKTREKDHCNKSKQHYIPNADKITSQHTDNLIQLYNKTLTTNEIPNRWKDAHIIPIHKDGEAL